MPDKTPEQLAEELKTSYKKAFGETKEIAEKALSEATKTGEILKQTAEKADESLLKMNGLAEQLAGLEQKMVRSTEVAQDSKSLGAQFVESEGVKQFLGQSEPRGRVDMSIKASITSLTTDVAGAAGDAVRAMRLDGIASLPQRRMTVRDLVTPGRTDGNAVEYVKETGFTNNAGPTAEGAALPGSDFKLELVSVPVRTLGHHIKASRQILDDAPQLSSLIDGRLRYGLAYKEEIQLLSGDGTGQNLMGIIPQATAYSAPFALAGATSIDMMRLAMLQAVNAELPATGHVMHPSDWAWLELLKDSTGRYIIGNPQGNAQPTLWGLPVVTTQAISVDKFLTGAFKMGAQIFDRWDASVELATENEDDFIKGMVTVRACERVALAVNRPEAFIYGDFGRVA